MLSAEYLREVLDYDRQTGTFRWRVRHGHALAGSVAGGVCQDGYRRIGINRQCHLEHRLAWLHIHGMWPTAQVDHINGNTLDNSILNLRLASNAQNQMNRRPSNRHGFKGITFNRTEQKWRAQIALGGKKITLGRFDTPEAAHDAYRNAAARLFGEFARVE